jgi:hypothetical protein
MTIACFAVKGEECHGLGCRGCHVGQADKLLDYCRGQVRRTSNGLQHVVRGAGKCVWATGSGQWELWCSGKNISQPRYE